MSLAIETEKLTKSYGRKARGIEDVDLAVEEGEVFGFLGPNGAGKTTTVRTLLGFLRPTGGRGEVFGLDIRKDSVEVRARVGNLPGEFALEDKMTGEGLLRFFARLRGVKDLGYARELAERLGAELHRPMRRLSRGNKQKIGLVQAMFHRPPLLDPRRANRRARPARAGGISRHHRGGKGRGTHRVLLLAQPRRGREGVRPRRDHPRRQARRGGDHGDADRQVLQARRPHVCGGRGPQAFRGPLRRQRPQGWGNRLAFTLYDDLDEMVKLAARHELVNMEYERPSLEEVFLTYYERENGEAR